MNEWDTDRETHTHTETKSNIQNTLQTSTHIYTQHRHTDTETYRDIHTYIHTYSIMRDSGVCESLSFVSSFVLLHIVAMHIY